VASPDSFISIHFVSNWHNNLSKFLAIIVAISIGASIGEAILKRFAKFFHGKVLFGPFKWADSILGAALSIARTLIMIFIVGKLLMAMPWGIGHNEIPKSCSSSPRWRSQLRMMNFNLHSLPSVRPSEISFIDIWIRRASLNLQQLDSRRHRVITVA
jgi:hypothetical protein